MEICTQLLFTITEMPQQPIALSKPLHEIVEIAQSLGGTASGEHGIGSIKAQFVVNEDFINSY